MPNADESGCDTIPEFDEAVIGTVHPDTVRHAISTGLVSKAELARLSGLHENTFRGVESDDWSPRWKTLEQMCAGVAKLKPQD